MFTRVPSICALLRHCCLEAPNMHAHPFASVLMGKKRIAGPTCAACGFAAIDPRARLRVTKLPPAPLMDGVDVSRFELGRVYTVEASRSEERRVGKARRSRGS